MLQSCATSECSIKYSEFMTFRSFNSWSSKEKLDWFGLESL